MRTLKVTEQLSKLFAGFVVGVEATNIETTSTHGLGMHSGLFNHVVGKVTRSILTTTIGYALLH